MFDSVTGAVFWAFLNLVWILPVIWTAWMLWRLVKAVEGIAQRQHEPTG
jgi:hypothetical protein